MRILGVLLGAFLGVTKWSNYETNSIYPRELVPSFTALHESVQEPKLPYSDTKTLPQKLFKSFFPLSILLSAFGLKESSVADDRVLPTSSNSSPANFSFSELRNVIQAGKVFVIKDFIDDDILAGLREDIQALVDTKKFAPSGLSNRAKGSNQGFDIRDRSVASVTFDSANNSKALLLVGEYIDQLRLSLAKEMKRPSMADITLAHESYFSRSLPGSKLNRHLDERHEETKGRKGWTTRSRRSISWLLYLCDENWTLKNNGGGLLSFPQERRVVGGPCGEHVGNLQVGWWKSDNTNMNKNRNENEDGNEYDKNEIELRNNARLSNLFSLFGNKEKSVNPLIAETVKTVDNGFVQPVFMDIWRKEYVNTDENKTKMTVIPRSALYVREKNSFGVFQRVYITRNFDSKDPITGAARDNYDDEFIELDGENKLLSNSNDKDEKISNNDGKNNNYVEGIEDGNVVKSKEMNFTGRKAKLAARFSRIEDIPAWERGEIPAGTVSFVTPPTGKSLVLFDSVCLPHEVMLTVEGNRLALAGWMHETQQDVPKWFDLTS